MEYALCSEALYAQTLKLNASDRAVPAGLLLESLESSTDEGVGSLA